jgi:MinD-like ATPase involved in chromosome partitioning or flagellar assembly
MKILSKRFGIREFSLMVTMSPRTAETEGVISRFSEVARTHLDVRINLLDIFPWEPKLSEAIRRQRPFVELYPENELTARFQKVCDKIEMHDAGKSHGLRFFYQDTNPLRRDKTCPV